MTHRADHDGTTWQWGGASAAGLPDTQPIAHPRPRPYVAAPPPPPMLLSGTQAPWVMTINPPGPGADPTPEALEVVGFLRTRVRLLRKRGQLDRISDETLAMLPALRQLKPHSYTTAREIIDDAAAILRPEREPWQPAPWPPQPLHERTADSAAGSEAAALLLGAGAR